MSETTPQTLAFLSQELLKLSDSELATVLNSPSPDSHGLAYLLVCNLSQEEKAALFECLLMVFDSGLWEDASLAERITDRGCVLRRWVDAESHPQNFLRRAGDFALASAIEDKAGTVQEWIFNGEVSISID